MFFNYLKITFRNFTKQKLFSFINVTGFALGLACCMLILLWVQDELSFDRFHDNNPHLYRVISFWDQYHWEGLPITPAPLGRVIRDELPQIENCVRMIHHNPKLFKYKDHAFYEEEGLIADPSLFTMFTFPVLRGDLKNAFHKPTDTMISESMAKKLFGKEDALGKSIFIEGEPSKITGVFKDIPLNSHLRFNYVNSYEFLEDLSNMDKSWSGYNHMTYLQLVPNSDPAEVAEKMTKIALEHRSGQVVSGAYFRLQPLKDVHFQPMSYQLPGYHVSDSRVVTMLTLIGLFVLVIACINFMNLSTARALNRAKEVGLRKTVGAGRGQMIGQFFGESMFMTLLSFALAILLVLILLPLTNSLAGKAMVFNLKDPVLLVSIFILLAVTGVLAGAYPALVLSSFKPAAVFKTSAMPKRGRSLFRKLLVTLQFSLSVILIISVMVMNRQLHFTKTMNMGLDRENVLMLPLKGAASTNFDTFKNELLGRPGIMQVSAHFNNLLKTTWHTTGLDWEGREKDADTDMVFSGIEPDFFKTLNMTFVSGRGNRDTESDLEEYVLNESAVAKTGLKDPVGKRFTFTPDYHGTIVGVVADAHFRSVHNEIEPRVYFIQDMAKASQNGMMLIRIMPGNVPETVKEVQSVWNRLNVAIPFEYHFMDAQYELLYLREMKLGALLNYFTLLALIISCLGLFGLATFMAQSRVKEIGIRKVLGASSTRIVASLSRDFLIWVALSNLLAWPAGWWISRQVLREYAYRIHISWVFFALSGAIVLFIALLTVGFQALKAARKNPVNSLRYE